MTDVPNTLPNRPSRAGVETGLVFVVVTLPIVFMFSGPGVVGIRVAVAALGIDLVARLVLSSPAVWVVSILAIIAGIAGIAFFLVRH